MDEYGNKQHNRNIITIVVCVSLSIVSLVIQFFLGGGA